MGNKCSNPERGIVSRSIDRAVISKLELKQSSVLVSLLVTTNILQYIAQNVIDHFCLIICLQMKSTSKLQLCTKLVPEMTLKLADKFHILVRSNSFQNTMQTHHLSKEQMRD